MGTDHSDQQTFGINIGDARSGPGTYSLYVPINSSPTNRGNSAYFARREKSYETNAKHRGTLTITRLDSVERIVAGEFRFTPIDPLTGDSVRITRGRFDLRY
ncbi:DUF6252 family protein [Hymenobacter cavernae]|uniref:DUF6252 family protein n=1 Tax=Hymenobacter cavernae TaxID=2044852 RepID=UPI001663FB32|nr:DUF6252 family protein [Hymenobacter cavernae]